MKRILVTGGAGFLGSHLCDQLIARGNHVICVDNLHTGSSSNIQHLITNPRFEFIEHDVSEPIDIKVEEIYNLGVERFQRRQMKAAVGLPGYLAPRILHQLKRSLVAKPSRDSALAQMEQI